jgi:ubiquinol-cytochrome c reductase cytochrome b subunit
VTINPIWLYGPYTPDQVTAGSQPDWYIGWLEGALRMMPNVEWVIFGYTLSLNILVPSVIVPGIVFTLMALYPWIEQWATGDKSEHHLLDRPRNAPVRTALGAMALSFYILLWIGGGNDLIAKFFDLSINAITWFLRIAIFIVPPLVFVITKRICLGLQRRDRDKLLHGMETGNILRLPHGEFIEIHAPISDEEKAVLMSKPQRLPLPMPEEVDENGVALKGARKARWRAKLSSFYYDDNIALPTREELEAAEAHLRHEVEEAAPVMEEDRRLVPARDGSVLHDPANDPK